MSTTTHSSSTPARPVPIPDMSNFYGHVELPVTSTSLPWTMQDRTKQNVSPCDVSTLDVSQLKLETSHIPGKHIRPQHNKLSKIRVHRIPDDVYKNAQQKCLEFYAAYSHVDAQILLRLLIEFSIASDVNTIRSIIGLICSITDYKAPRIAMAIKMGAGADATRHRWYLLNSIYKLHAAPSDGGEA